MAALVLAILSLSAAISCGLVLLLIVKTARERGFPPPTSADAKVFVYAGFLMAVLAALSITAKETSRDLLPRHMPGLETPAAFPSTVFTSPPATSR